jgi:metal-sulfur cluster biosynthetic enzyme
MSDLAGGPERGVAAVAAATRRTRHAPDAAVGDGAPDPRYSSADAAEQRIWLALREVMDPEIPVSLVDLGLICAVRHNAGVAEVDVTFTATACPCMEFIHADIRERLLAEPEIDEVRIRDVWERPWTTERMTAAGRASLKQFGMTS